MPSGRVPPASVSVADATGGATAGVLGGTEPAPATGGGAAFAGLPGSAGKKPEKVPPKPTSSPEADAPTTGVIAKPGTTTCSGATDAPRFQPDAAITLPIPSHSIATTPPLQLDPRQDCPLVYNLRMRGAI